MGTTNSNTRRISFDNSCDLTAASVVERSFHQENIGDLNPTTKQIDDEVDDLALFQSKKARNAAVRGDDYWIKRIDYLQKAHQNINEIIETEYEKAVENTNKLFQKPKADKTDVDKLTPCLKMQAKVLKCYQENPHQTLVCSSVVQAFNNCVAASRIEE